MERVRDKLIATGYSIISTAQTDKRGYDIDATKTGVRLIIEAKGATSSKPDTKDFGKPWGKGKLSHSLAQAVLRTMETMAEFRERNTPVEVGIALPDVPYYRSTVKKILNILGESRIKVYLVTTNDVEVL